MAVETRKKTRITPYDAWMDHENIPVARAHGITDLGEPEFGHWDRHGCEAYFVGLYGMEGFTGGHVCKIPAGGSTKEVHHVYENIVYILQGRGATTLRGPKGDTIQFEWQEGSLFAIPLNAPYRFFAHDQDVMFVAFTTGPIMFDFLHSADFIYGSDFAFRDRFDGEPEFMHKDVRKEELNSTLLGNYNRRNWETNFIADARKTLPDSIDPKGGTLRYIQYEFCANSLITHQSKYPTGAYMQGHYHGGGAILVILRSQGYSLMWPKEIGTHPFEDGLGDQVVRMDWKVGSIFSPQTGWYHQHFNTGNEDALQLAIRYGSNKFPVGLWDALGGGEAADGQVKTMVSAREGGHIIPYEDEDPAMRRMFNEGIQKNGVKAWEGMSVTRPIGLGVH